MRLLILRATLLTAALATSALAQMHKVAKPEQVVRAVGVYEWTGDFAKPTASRLIPVTVFIDGKLEDAGVYIARPIPFALLPGNVYILQTAGIDKATLDLAYAKHLQAVESTGDLAYDDGWFGYGSVKPLAAPRRTTTALKPSKNLPVITAANDKGPHLNSKPATDSTTTTTSDSKPSASSGTTTTTTSDDSDRPTMKRRDSSTTNTSSTTPSTTNQTSTTSTPSDDPDRPTLARRNPTTSTPDSTSSTSSTTQSTGSTPADDPDRPTMTRRSPTTSTTDSTPSSTSASDTPGSDDSDRPTLKRHSPADAKHSSSNTNGDSVSAVGDLNADPNRPNLHHGKPTSSMTDADLPPLKGMPTNLHQSVAVSDAVNRDPHPFTLEWDDEAQHQAILQKMQALAQAQLAAYGKAPAATPSASTTTAKKTTPTTAAAARTRKPASPPAQPLLDEELKAYTLSYGGAPTYVYTADTGGTGAALRYVTIVAQADGMGELKPAIQNVTDAAHLDRSHDVRQFALYRVIASHPDRIFVTGTTQ
jgi:hypothetical protein